jgi:hypothetical protein
VCAIQAQQLGLSERGVGVWRCVKEEFLYIGWGESGGDVVSQGIYDETVVVIIQYTSRLASFFSGGDEGQSGGGESRSLMWS